MFLGFKPLPTMLLKIICCFLLSAGALEISVSKRQANRFEIKPPGPSHKPVGKNLFFTCKADVANPALVRDLKWLKPNGQPIPEDDRFIFFYI